MPSQRTTALALGLTFALLAAAPAEAQTCAMLRPGVPAEGTTAPDDVVARVQEAVAGQLLEHVATVLSSEDAARRMVGQPYSECAALDCGGSVVRALGVDFAVLVTIWAPRGTPTSVVVTFIGADDSVAGDAPVQNGEVVAAALTALQTARQRWGASQMGFLVLTSSPSGASVEVDGRVIGTTPLRHLVMAGQREVRVVLDGYATAEHRVMVTATEESSLDVALTPDEAVAPATSRTSDEPSVLNWVIGGGFVAAGLGLLVSPIYALAIDGSCVGDPPCAEIHQFGVANGVLLGVAGAALVGGVVFLAAQPIRVSVTASGDSASIELRGTF